MTLLIWMSTLYEIPNSSECSTSSKLGRRRAASSSFQAGIFHLAFYPDRKREQEFYSDPKIHRWAAPHLV
jgi:hypothetical protein